jgi:ATP-dependent DNA ligase
MTATMVHEGPLTAPLRRQSEPFDDPVWIYEIKHDGFRALAVIEQGKCRVVSRKHRTLSGFRTLREALVQEVKARTAILDGELVVADEHGRTVFASMMKRGRHDVRYFAFDLFWLNGWPMWTRFPTGSDTRRNSHGLPGSECRATSQRRGTEE